MDIKENIIKIRKQLPEHVSLIAVSKFHSEDEIMQAYEAGQRSFGENHAQEISKKYADLPKDIQWHFIGHLQTNKVKYIVPFVHMIHSVDSVKLLKEINKEAGKNGRVVNCLLQIHIAEEETKFGFTPEECIDLCRHVNFSDYANVRICGLMGMATNTDDTEEIRKEFKTLKALLSELKETCFSSSAEFKELSMGMSEDYKIAIEEGSTMVRVGSKIFGERIYNK